MYILKPRAGLVSIAGRVSARSRLVPRAGFFYLLRCGARSVRCGAVRARLRATGFRGAGRAARVGSPHRFLLFVSTFDPLQFYCMSG